MAAGGIRHGFGQSESSFTSSNNISQAHEHQNRSDRFSFEGRASHESNVSCDEGRTSYGDRTSNGARPSYDEDCGYYEDPSPSHLEENTAGEVKTNHPPESVDIDLPVKDTGKAQQQSPMPMSPPVHLTTLGGARESSKRAGKEGAGSSQVGLDHSTPGLPEQQNKLKKGLNEWIEHEGEDKPAPDGGNRAPHRHPSDNPFLNSPRGKETQGEYDEHGEGGEGGGLAVEATSDILDGFTRQRSFQEEQKLSMGDFVRMTSSSNVLSSEVKHLQRRASLQHEKRVSVVQNLNQSAFAPSMAETIEFQDLRADIEELRHALLHETNLRRRAEARAEELEQQLVDERASHTTAVAQLKLMRQEKERMIQHIDAQENLVRANYKDEAYGQRRMQMLEEALAEKEALVQKITAQVMWERKLLGIPWHHSGQIEDDNFDDDDDDDDDDEFNLFKVQPLG